jgi:dTDP-4-dehydrorhamnose 3,5-epimerase
MKKEETALPGVYILEPQVHVDLRGFFMESYNSEAMREHGIAIEFLQDNHIWNEQVGVLRGLHYQLQPKAQTKLIRVISGESYHVAVDLRRRSPTFGAWIGTILSSNNKKQLLIPKGLAHGYCTLAPNTEVLYKVDEYYSPEYDRGIRWDDPELSIDWPISVPILSDKDQQQPSLKTAEYFD